MGQIFRNMLKLRYTSLILLFGLTGCHREIPIQKQTRFLMDTYVTIQIPGDTGQLKVIEKAFQRIEEIDQKFNILDPSNPLYAFNMNNQTITDSEIVYLIHKALEVSAQTKGAFDITVYPLVKLWGFFGDSPALPADAAIQKLIKYVGYRQLVSTENGISKKNSHVQIDLGGIAKGYAVSEAVKVIKAEGVESALIDAGGDIYALGQLNGHPWKVGIRNPRGEGVIGAFDISDLAVVTSGDYERFFMKDGIRYHHILDPKTGYPARGVASVTIITADATLADALSTAVFVMGKDRGMAFIEGSDTIEGVIILNSGEIFSSSGLK